MKSAVPYLIFGVIYFVAVSLLGATLGNLTEGVVSTAVELLTPFAAAPLALLVARGAGALAARGLLITTAIIVVIGYMTITLLSASMAGDAGDEINLLSLARLGGLPLALGTAVFLVAPLLWLCLRLPKEIPG